MASVSKLAPKILKWEGGFVNDPADAGGATNKGVTLSTWRQCGYDKDGDGDIDVNDLKLINEADFTIVLKKYYWDRWKADIIGNQSVANILVDWVWGSGKWGIVIPQRILKVVDDGVVGMKTIMALNNTNQKELFDKIWKAREDFLNNIVLDSIHKFEENIALLKKGITPAGHSSEYWAGALAYYNAKGAGEAYKKYTNARFIHGWMNRLNDFTWEG